MTKPIALVPFGVLVVALAAGCSNAPEPAPAPAPLAPVVAQFEAEQCDVIKNITPGFLETSWATAVLSDVNATADERTQALRTSAAQLGSASKRTSAYTCDGSVWERYLAEAYLREARTMQGG